MPMEEMKTGLTGAIVKALNSPGSHLASHCFDFQAYSAGFAKACMDIFEQI